MSKPIYLTILAMVAAIFVALPLVQVPVSTSSRGMVRAMQENTKVAAVVSGKVVASSLEKNNQIIQKGDTLLVITSEQLDTQKHLQQSQSADYAAQLADLQRLSAGQYTGLQTGQYQRELSAMQEKITQVKTELNLAQKDFSRVETLYKQGVVPKAEYDKFYYNLQGLKSQIASIQQQQIALWQAQKREVERQVRSLGAEVARIGQEQNNYIVTAPISGRLVGFSGIQKGNFIIQGQPIGEISPDKNMVAECMISPKDIGFIKKKQKVKFQIDAYNYNQWGLLNGTVSEIDQNITVNQQTGEAFFRVLCKMDRDYLSLKNGYQGNIGKGMSFTARFYLIDRTLWQLLFDRIDDWFNPNLR